MSIRSIEASGHMVKITDSDGIESLVNRKEALLRAQAVIGLDGPAAELTANLIKAANQARINELGYPYSSRELDAFLRAVQAQGKAHPIA